ncbi:DUF6415 family natural product biosynthesis protein [Streptomyces gamaensis]|uniref:DUF6415 family natural product biosynthesis protein n=1 Tax=Streptomyces gamaensis TaxID=1763542 RepID=A0ABW0Z6N6_9ACTN
MVPPFPHTGMCGLPQRQTVDDIVGLLLDQNVVPQPPAKELREWIRQLTQDVCRSIRSVAGAALLLPADHPGRAPALAAADKAANRVRVGSGPGYKAAMAYAMGLAGDVRTLREHRRALGSQPHGEAAHTQSPDGKEPLSERIAAVNARSRRRLDGVL